MSSGLEIIEVRTSPGLDGAPQVRSFNAYFSGSDLPDADAWRPVLEVLAGNLARIRPREDLVFWTHTIGNGEVSLGMTRPAKSNRSILPLLKGSPTQTSGHGQGYLADEPQPVLKWSASGELIRLWPGAPPSDAPQEMGRMPVVNRQCRVVGFPDEE